MNRSNNFWYCMLLYSMCSLIFRSLGSAEMQTSKVFFGIKSCWSNREASLDGHWWASSLDVNKTSSRCGRLLSRVLKCFPLKCTHFGVPLIPLKNSVALTCSMCNSDLKCVLANHAVATCYLSFKPASVFPTIIQGVIRMWINLL